MLMGSISSVTPAFSTCVSPSSEFSSKVKPYWKPEQPPPCTNTRSFKFGFASSRISSPTLAAAASVKTSVGAADSGVMAVSMGTEGAGIKPASKFKRSAARRLLFPCVRGLGEGLGPLARLVDKLAVDLRAHLHLDQRVI